MVQLLASVSFRSPTPPTFCHSTSRTCQASPVHSHVSSSDYRPSESSRSLVADQSQTNGCHIHTDIRNPQPTWLLLIPNQDQEEPKQSGQGMRLAFGLGLEWQSLESLPRVKSEWVKGCWQSGRILDHSLYGLKSIIDPDKSTKQHPRHNFVSCKDTDKLYRLLRILQHLDSYFDPQKRLDPSSPTPSRTAFYRIQDQLDLKDGKRFSGSTRSFMAPYIHMLEYACPPFTASAKESSRKSRTRQPPKPPPKIARSPTPRLVESAIAPSDLTSVSKPTSDVSDMASQSAIMNSSTTQPVPTRSIPSPPRKRPIEPPPTTSPSSSLPSLATTSLQATRRPDPTSISQTSSAVNHDDDQQAAHALLDLGTDEEEGQGLGIHSDQLVHSNDTGIGFVIDIDHPRARSSTSPTNPFSRASDRSHSRSPTSTPTPTPLSITLPITILEPSSARDVAPISSTRKRKLEDLDDTGTDTPGQPRRMFHLADATQNQDHEIGQGPEDGEDERAALSLDSMGKERAGRASLPESDEAETVVSAGLSFKSNIPRSTCSPVSSYAATWND